jgi:hypothetical protein
MELVIAGAKITSESLYCFSVKNFSLMGELFTRRANFIRNLEHKKTPAVIAGVS